MRIKRYGLAIMIAFLAIIIILRNQGLGTGFFNSFNVIPHYDKWGHFFLMGILSYFAVSVLASRPWFLVVIGVTLIMGVEELSQSLSPMRTLSLMDFLASTLGILSFGWLARKPYASRELESGAQGNQC